MAECKRNILCIGKKDCRKKRNRNRGICNCESWFSGDPILTQACVSATKGGNYADSREDFILRIYGEQNFIDQFGYDPLPGIGLDIKDSGRFADIRDQEANIQEKEMIIEIAIILIVAAIAILIIRR